MAAAPTWPVSGQYNQHNTRVFTLDGTMAHVSRTDEGGSTSYRPDHDVDRIESSVSRLYGFHSSEDEVGLSLLLSDQQ